MEYFKWYEQIGVIFCWVIPLFLIGGWLGYKLLLTVFWLNTLLVTRKIPWKKAEDIQEQQNE